MRIDILTSVPELLVSPLNESILKRAQSKGLVEIAVHNLHDYAHDKRRTTDDYPFGGEAGMVMKPEPVFELVEKLQSERRYDEIIYTSPDGVRYDQHEANRLSTLENIIILCGHYKDTLLAPPVYTRPAEFRGWRVPDVLLSGNFAEIEKWQDEQAWERTRRLRPDLLGGEEAAK